MAAGDIVEIMEQAFGENNILRARIFICCVTEDHIIVITGTQGRLPGESHYPQFDIILLTVCGRCHRQAEGSGGRGAYIGLSEDLVNSWRVCKALRKYCEGGVKIVTQIVDLDGIMRECKAYKVQLQTAAISNLIAEDGGDLRLLSYLDSAFL